MIARGIAALMVLASLAACEPADVTGWQGYVEAEYTYVAPLESGRITELAVARGDLVKAGQTLFALEQDAERAARDQAAAELAQAESDLADLRKGERPEDLAIIEAQLDEARASLSLSVPRLKRRETMVKGAIIGEEELDEAKSQILSDRGNIAEYEARLAEAKLPARADQLAAQEALVNARRAQLAQADWNLAKRQETAPADARVEDVFYRLGETAGAGEAVVSLLSPGQLKLRFFVPEPALSGIAVGQTLAVTCDGCAAGLSATITFIAREAEFTPPVIYSVTRREKLVFMVEAVPTDLGQPLGQPLRQPWHPGLPVYLSPTTAGAGS